MRHPNEQTLVNRSSLDVTVAASALRVEARALGQKYTHALEQQIWRQCAATPATPAAIAA